MADMTRALPIIVVAMGLAMALRGFDGGSVRLPLRDLDGAALAAVSEVMQALAADPRSGVTLARR